MSRQTQFGTDRRVVQAVYSRSSRAGEQGFSLVEIMVALVIGMLGVVIILQVFALFEGQKRTTTSGDDAISGGAIALNILQRDLRHAGWGMSARNVLACDVDGLASGSTLTLAPVTINHASIPAGDPNTDTLTVVYGSGSGPVEGDTILSDSWTPVGTVTQDSYAVGASRAFAVDDFVAAGPKERSGAACSLKTVRVTKIDDPKARTVSVSDIAPFSVNPGDRLFQFGQNPVVRVYAIRDGSLTVCDWRTSPCADASKINDRGIWVPIANNMVSLRAQYGRDTATGDMDGIVDVWDKDRPITGISTIASKNIPACGIMRVSAVRLVLVARSSQPEKEHVSSAAAGWTHLRWMALEDDTGALLSTPPSAGTAAEGVVITLPNPDAVWPTWQNFRYKTFQTVVPLRNITMQGAMEEC